MTTGPDGLTPLIRYSHRHSYPPFVAPALTCHVIARFEREHGIPKFTPVEGESDKIRRGRIEKAIEDARTFNIENINATLALIDPDGETHSHARRFEHPEEPPETASPPPPKPWIWRKQAAASPLPPPPEPPPRCHSEETLSFLTQPFGQFAMGVVVEISSEYVALSFRAWPLPRTENAEASDAQKTDAAYQTILRIMAGDIRPDPDANGADEAIRHLFDAFWDSYFLSLFNDPSLTGETARRRLFDGLGSHTGEFQGLVLRTKYPPPADAAKREEAYKTLAQQQIARAADNEDATQREYPDVALTGELIQFAPQQGQDKLSKVQDELRAFINARKSFFSRLLGFRLPKDRKPFNPGNAVLSFMFDGLGVHGSTLGGDDDRVSRYFVVYGGPSRHQLGRLVMALHHCGEVRLAGFFDYDELSLASHRIRIQDEAFGAVDPTDRVALNKDLELYRGEIAEIAKLGGGSLSFRIARAKYYADSIERQLANLRVERIDGWQTYEGFVRRNVLRRLHDIAAIGLRFEALQRRMRQIDSAATTLHLDDQQSKLVTLQTTAEIIAYGAFTYYLGSVAGAFFGGMPFFNDHLDTMCNMMGAHCAVVHDPHHEPDRIAELLAFEHKKEVAHVSGFLFAGVVAIAFFLLSKRKKR